MLDSKMSFFQNTTNQKKIRDNLYHYANNKAAFPGEKAEAKKQTAKKAAK